VLLNSNLCSKPPILVFEGGAVFWYFILIHSCILYPGP
jgi:hypothetical protein